MGLIRWLLSLLFGGNAVPRKIATEETIEDVADRIDRFGDRCRNAGDAAGADAARDASRRARRVRSVEAAWQIERDLLNGRGYREPKVVKPIVGRNAVGKPSVQFGNRTRVGGSVGWRNNNPGYIRCDDRLARYGAIGCDGEYAIFESESAGRGAMIEFLRREYPSHTLGEALREQLPAEAGPNAAERVLETARMDPGTRVEELTLDQIGTVADTFPEIAGWQLGESVESPIESDDPAWDVITASGSSDDS